MALTLSIKNVPDALAVKLRARAEANHRSLQGELMALIESSVRNDVADDASSRPSAPRLGTTLGTTLVATSLSTRRAGASPTLTLREVGERVRRRFPAPLALPPGTSAAELVRQMRDGRNGTREVNADYPDQGI